MIPLVWRIVAVLAALAALLGVVAYGVQKVKADGAASQRAAMAEAAAAQERHDAAETDRRLSKQAGAVHDATVQTDAALAAARAADARARSMRQQLNAYVAHARAADPSASGAGASDPIGVLAEVLGSADDFAGRVAAEADANRIAGIACERSYDALKP